jgi:hypothetical protein
MAVVVRRERPDRELYETVMDQVAGLNMPEWKEREKLGQGIGDNHRDVVVPENNAEGHS